MHRPLCTTDPIHSALRIHRLWGWDSRRCLDLGVLGRGSSLGRSDSWGLSSGCCHTQESPGIVLYLLVISLYILINKYDYTLLTIYNFISLCCNNSAANTVTANTCQDGHLCKQLAGFSLTHTSQRFCSHLIIYNTQGQLSFLSVSRDFRQAIWQQS